MLPVVRFLVIETASALKHLISFSVNFFFKFNLPYPGHLRNCVHLSEFVGVPCQCPLDSLERYRAVNIPRCSVYISGLQQE
jgi:hypothetical protein